MAGMIVRNIPDDVMERFKQRARAEGKSAAQLAREAIAEKAQPSRQAALEAIDAFRAATKPMADLDIVSEIRRDRNDRDKVASPIRSDAAE